MLCAITKAQNINNVQTQIPKEEAFTNIIVEQYKGAWCGYCPRTDYKLKRARENNSKIIPVNIHYYDDMQYTNISSMMDIFNINGFPTAIINRNSIWGEASISWEGPFNNLNNLATGEASVGIGLEYIKQGEQLNVKVELEYKTYQNSKLVVYIL